MRKYQNKKNAQKQNYYKDRFYHAPHVAYDDVEQSVFAQDFAKISLVDGVEGGYVELGTLVILARSQSIVQVISALKDLGYNSWTELACIDMIDAGYEIVYMLLDMARAQRVRVKISVPNGASVPSVALVFKAANWAEREAYDMYGVIFDNHPNPKRLLMPDDWYDHPLKKSYPLQGDEKAQWYEIDRIFGKQHRQAVGAENRDSGYVNDEDYENFARIYHESPRGTKPLEIAYLQEYQEEDGVMFVKPVKRKKD